MDLFLLNTVNPQYIWQSSTEKPFCQKAISFLSASEKFAIMSFKGNDLWRQMWHLYDIQVPGRCQHGGDDVFDREIPDAMMRERAKQ